MKTLSVIFFPFLLLSCEVNNSIKKDIKTGEFSKGNGISCINIEISVNEKNTKNNIFKFGDEVKFTFKDVKGLIKKGNKFFPKISMTIIKNDKDTVFNNSNLLKESEDGIEMSPLVLEAFFVSALPYKNKENYVVNIFISDKNSNGNFMYSFPFTVVENNLLKVTQNNLKYTNIYLWDNTLKKVVNDNKVKQSNSILLMIEGVEGLNLVDDKVFPILSLELKNKNGKAIINDPNLLKTYENTGVNSEDLKSQVSAEINFTEGLLVNPYNLKLILKDKNSQKNIEVNTSIIVEK